MSDIDISRWRSILDRIRERLSDPNISSKEARELREIEAKMHIMGPSFMRANIDRLRGMFDKDFL